MPVHITHLFEVPHHRISVASLIHDEFWTEVPGASVQAMAERIAQARSADAVPLCLVAVNHSDEVLGAVNLVESDNDDHPEWTPWLAGMVVAAPWRSRGVGTALVQALLAHARRLGLQQVYLGSDGPGFYTRLGAAVHARPRKGFCFLRFDLGAG